MSEPVIETEQKPRVLLVDDEEGVRMSLRALLDREYRISSVASGEAAVEELPRFRPDLVLLDVKLLPSMSGLDTLQYIKSFDERIEVVMITAFASLVTLNEALRRGAFGYLIKPFPRRDLALMVRDALARRSGRVDGG
jgi:DNA-binding NtrC family response regulator